MQKFGSPAKNEHAHAHKEEEEGQLLVAALHRVGDSLANMSALKEPSRKIKKGKITYLYLTGPHLLYLDLSVGGKTPPPLPLSISAGKLLD